MREPVPVRGFEHTPHGIRVIALHPPEVYLTSDRDDAGELLIAMGLAADDAWRRAHSEPSPDRTCHYCEGAGMDEEDYPCGACGATGRQPPLPTAEWAALRARLAAEAVARHWYRAGRVWCARSCLSLGVPTWVPSSDVDDDTRVFGVYRAGATEPPGGGARSP